MPWRATWLYARVAPFWIAYEVDGLETVCRAAGIAPPDVLVPAWRPFAEACPERFTALDLLVRNGERMGSVCNPMNKLFSGHTVP